MSVTGPILTLRRMTAGALLAGTIAFTCTGDDRVQSQPPSGEIFYIVARGDPEFGTIRTDVGRMFSIDLADGDSPRAVLDGVSVIDSISPAGDSRLLAAVQRGDELAETGRADGSRVIVLDVTSGSVVAAVDGRIPAMDTTRRVALCDEQSDRSVIVVEIGSNGETRVLAQDVFGFTNLRPGNCPRPAWSRDGRLAALVAEIGSGSPAVLAWTDLAGRDVIIEDPAIGGNSVSSWSSDSRHISFQTGFGTKVVTQDGEPIATYPAAERAVFSPTNPRVFAAIDSTRSELLVYSLDVSAELASLGDIDSTGEFAWSPDGNWIALTTDLGIAIWNVESNELHSVIEVDYPRELALDAIAWVAPAP